jgi:hypothetical protein
MGLVPKVRKGSTGHSVLRKDEIARYILQNPATLRDLIDTHFLNTGRRIRTRGVSCR